MRKILFGILSAFLLIGNTTQAQTEECINFNNINLPIDGSPLDFTQGKINIKTGPSTTWGKQSVSELYFVGWVNIDVSYESCKSKKLTVSHSATEYIAIDGDTIHLVGMINNFNSKYTLSFNSGNLVVAGEFDKVSIGNSTNIIDHICLNTESCDALGYTEQKNEIIKIGPNPTQGLVNINFNYSELNIYSSAGVLVYRAKKQQKQIDLSFLPRGYYFIHAISQDQTINHKILLE